MTNVDDEELKRLREIERVVRSMFDTADGEGLFIGIGRNGDLPIDKQEGPQVRKLRALVKGPQAPRR